MKNLGPPAYRALFLKHVHRFLVDVARPQELLRAHLLAVSGGVDSMALLWFAHALFQQGKIGQIRVAFIHHHTRAGQDLDEKLVRNFCHSRGIPFEVLHAQGLKAEMGNFESQARLVRRQLLFEHLKTGELLWQGHHLDDSHEWSLLQRFRSSRPQSSLGIPVRNGPILRPFLCVSKVQIRRLAHLAGIPYREDPSNRDVRFERNFLREEMIPLIKQRYPNYLRHYVNHANYLAMVLNLSIIHRVHGQEVHVYHQGAVILGTGLSQFQIQDLLQHFSTQKRGELSLQILRMLKAIDNGKKGPFQFSGQTEVYYTHRLMMIYQRTFKNADQSMAKILRRLGEKDLDELALLDVQDLQRFWQNLLQSSDAMASLPGLVLICESQSVCKTLNASVYDSLFPEVSQVVRERGWHFVTALKGIDTWKRKKEKLPVLLKILPLWTLSNLFSFQE